MLKKKKSCLYIYSYIVFNLLCPFSEFEILDTAVLHSKIVFGSFPGFLFLF